VGSIVHEMVHVVQQYGDYREPSWVVEGLPIYIRFYLFEPEVRGADITPRVANRVRYDDSYRITANFLNWVVKQRGARPLARCECRDANKPSRCAIVRREWRPKRRFQNFSGRFCRSLATNALDSVT
jgi:hypothetical protein